MRIILDTNVFVSGIFWSGPPCKILEAWHERKVKLVLSEEILNEYDRVAKAISKKYPDIDLSPFMELLAFHAEMYVPMKLPHSISRDPDDDKFIACALSSNVNLIVSGDQDLVVISNFREVKIVSPADFVKKHLAKIK